MKKNPVVKRRLKRRTVSKSPMPACQNEKALLNQIKLTCQEIGKEMKLHISTCRMMIESIGDGKHFWWTNGHVMVMVTGDQLVGVMNKTQYTKTVLVDIPDASTKDKWKYDGDGISTDGHPYPTILLAEDRFEGYVQGYTTPWLWPMDFEYAALISEAPLKSDLHVDVEHNPLFVLEKYLKVFREEFWTLNVLIAGDCAFRNQVFIYYPEIPDQPAGIVMPFLTGKEFPNYFLKRDGGDS